MSFNTAIPTSSDPIPRSYNQLRANFQAMNAAFSDNHSGFTQDSDTSGQHTVLTLRPQSGMTPDPTTSATQIGLYNKLVSSIPELFFRPSSSGTPIQMTYPTIKVDSTANQYSFSAGPFIIYGGLITAPTQGQMVTLTPGTTLVYVDLVATSPKNIPSNAIITAAPINISGTTFTIQYPNNISGGGKTFNLYYFAVGI